MKKLISFFVFYFLLFAFSFAQNIGISKNPPLEKLHVDSGSIKIGYNVYNPSFPKTLLKFGDGDYVTIGEDESDDRMLIKAKDVIFRPSPGYTGYVGINTNYTPVSPLEIYSASGDVAVSPGLRLTTPSSGSYPDVSWNIYNYNGGSGFAQVLFFAWGGSNIADIDAFGAYHQVSDKNLKKSIIYYENESVLQKIRQLKPAHYYMKADSSNAAEQIGFIAQDLEKQFPQLVSITKGTRMVNYTGLIPILTKGMQEQQQQIASLQQQINELKAVISAKKIKP